MQLLRARTPSSPRLVRMLGWLSLSVLLAHCAGGGSYVWIDDWENATRGNVEYYLRPGDSVSVLVWKQNQLSGTFTILEDGSITIPLVGDVRVAGLTLSGASEQVARRLEGFVVDPQVTVAVENTRAQFVSVVGEVKTVGRYPLEINTTLLDLIAKAGGPTDFASDNRVFVLRRGEPQRIRFSYSALIRGEGKGLEFQLRDGDVVVVE